MAESAVSMTPNHVYTWAGDPPIDRAVSVTSIISGGVPKFLTAWAAKMAAEYAVYNVEAWADMDPAESVNLIKRASDRHRDTAADIGTRAHAWAEQRAAGNTTTPDPDIKGHAEQFETFLTDWTPDYFEQEVVVFSRQHGYAGTLDAIAHLPGLGLTLLDIKTGKGVYPEVALQLAAYAHADFIGRDDGTEDPIPTFDSYAVLHLRPKSYNVIPVEVTDDVYRSFLYAAEVRRFAATSRRLIGSPLPSPEKVA